MDVKLSGAISPHIWRRISDLDSELIDKRSEAPKEEIHQLLQQTVLVGGKRLRPMLTFLWGDFYGLDPALIRPYAKAIELVHAASLSHDDVIDGASERRGVPSINAHELGSNKRAVLAGDYLLAQVIVDVCAEGHLPIVQELSHVIQELSLGEWVQLNQSQSIINPSFALIEQVALYKTSSVMSFCGVAPALLAGRDSLEVAKVRQFGRSLGLAFQYVDDALDFDPSEESGKNKLQDLKNGIINSVAFEYFKYDQAACRQWQMHNDILWNEKYLQMAKANVRERAAGEIARAHAILEQISGSEGGQGARKSLKFLMEFLINRKK